MDADVAATAAAAVVIAAATSFHFFLFCRCYFNFVFVSFWISNIIRRRWSNTFCCSYSSFIFAFTLYVPGLPFANARQICVFFSFYFYFYFYYVKHLGVWHICIYETIIEFGMLNETRRICADCVGFILVLQISIIQFLKIFHRLCTRKLHTLFLFSTPPFSRKKGFWSAWKQPIDFFSQSQGEVFLWDCRKKSGCLWWDCTERSVKENAAQKPIILPLVENYAKTMGTISHRFTWASCGQCK